MVVGDLVRSGISRYLVRRAVDRGDLLLTGRAAVSCPGTDTAVVAAVSRRASLACVSALEHHGIDLWRPPERVHLSANRERPGPGIYWHRGPRDGLAVPLARATAQTLRCLPAVDALVAVDSVLRSGRCTRAEIAAERLRWPAPAGWVLAHASAVAGSVLESAFRYQLIRAAVTTPGLRQLVEQAQVDGVGWVDFLVGGWLILETDGKGFHTGPERFALDRRRDAAAAERGYQTLRFTWAEVRDTPAVAVARVRRVLGFGPPGGTVPHRGSWIRDGL